MALFPIAFFLVYITGIAFAVIVDASFGIYTYQIEYFINPRIRWWYGHLPDIRYPFIVALFTLAGYAYRYRQYQQNRLFDVPQSKWCLAMVILFALISFIAVWPESHNGILRAHVKLVLFVYIMYKVVDTPKKFERMIWVFLTGSFYIGWIAREIGRNSGQRLEGIGPVDGSDANGLGALMITAIPMCIFYIIEAKRNWQKILAIVFLAFVLNAVILINSRGAFLGMIASLLYMTYFYVIKIIKGKSNRRVIWIAGSILMLFLFFRLADATFFERMNTLTETKAGEGGATRTYFWLKGIDLVKQYPLGVGGWGYMYLSHSFLPEEYLSGGLRAAHSTWIQALTELGFLGFIFFLAYVVASFKSMRMARNHFQEKEDPYLYYQSVALSSSFVAFLAASTFIDRLWAEIMYFLPGYMGVFYNIYCLKKYTSEESCLF